MTQWNPKKQEGCTQPEDVFFRKSKDGPNLAKAHAVILADQSEIFKTKLHVGGLHTTILCDWTSSTDSEVALQAFVKTLYGSGPDLATLDFKTLLDVHCLASHYGILELRMHLAEEIKEAKIPLDEIPSYLTYTNDRTDCTNEKPERMRAVRCSIKKTLLEKPGNWSTIAIWTNIDLSHLREYLSKSLSTRISLDDLLDAYKKFLALKVCYSRVCYPLVFSFNKKIT